MGLMYAKGPGSAVRRGSGSAEFSLSKLRATDVANRTLGPALFQYHDMVRFSTQAKEGPMSRRGMDQFLQFITACAYMQAIEEAKSSDRSARGALRSNQDRSADCEKPSRVVPIGRFQVGQAVRSTLELVTAKAIQASLVVVLMLLPLIWLIV